MIRQFDRSYKRRAYLHNYTELEVFKDLSEFEESRDVMMGTIEEYKSAEGVDYIHCLVCSRKQNHMQLELMWLNVVVWNGHTSLDRARVAW